MKNLTQDKLWKAIFEDFFPEAVAFYFPDFHPKVDWERGYELLDKELQQIYPESEETHRRADLLVKVWLLDGTEQWLLIHIEVQGYKDPDFPRRMFIYFYRLTDRFGVPVSALAMLTDAEKYWRPDHYHYRCMETEMVYRYPVYKLAEHTAEEFEGNENPWALVMKTALAGLKSNWDDDSLLNMKVGLYREMRQRGYSIKQAKGMFRFIKYYVHFGKMEYFANFEEKIRIVDNKKAEPMGVAELVKKHMIEEAIEEAIEEGSEKGMEKGMEVGVEKGIQIGWEFGLDEGMEQGMEQGMEKQARIAMQRIIKKYPNMANEELAEILDKPMAFIEKLRKEMEKKDQKPHQQSNKRQRKSK